MLPTWSVAVQFFVLQFFCKRPYPSCLTCLQTLLGQSAFPLCGDVQWRQTSVGTRPELPNRSVGHRVTRDGRTSLQKLPLTLPVRRQGTEGSHQSRALGPARLLCLSPAVPDRRTASSGDRRSERRAVAGSGPQSGTQMCPPSVTRDPWPVTRD